MLGDIDRRPAVLAAQGEALHAAHQDQQDRRDDPGLLVGRQQGDGEGGAAHQQHRGQERALAAGLVADLAEHQRPERPEREADPEQGQGRDIAGGLRQAREEGLGDHLGQAAEDEEVVPLEGGARRRGRHHRAHRRAVFTLILGRHALVSPEFLEEH
jgi:hypothetical protein